MERRLDRTSDVYAGTHSTAAFQQHHRLRVHWMCRQVRGRRVLDVGCSQGIVAILLAREGLEVVGADIEPELIRQAQEALAAEPESVQRRVTFVTGDILSDDLDLGRFDTVIAGEVVEHLVQPERLIARCHEFLNDGGTLVVTVPFGLHPFPDHKRTYHLTDLIKTLSPYFAVRDVELLHVVAGAESPAPIIGAVAERQAEPGPADWSRAVEWLQFSESGFSVAEQRYTAQLDRLVGRRDELAERQRVLQADLRSAQAQVSELTRKLAAAEREARSGAEREAELRKDLQAAAGREKELERKLDAQAAECAGLAALERELRSAARERERAVRYLARRLGMMEDATSYRLGLLIVRALRRPYLLLALPFQAAGLLISAAASKLKARGRREPRMAELPMKLPPIPEGAGRPRARGQAQAPVSPRPTAPREDVSATGDSETTRLLLAGMYEDPRSVSDLVVAAILDEFSLECFRPECRVVTFRPDNWQGILERERPHFLFIESAWKGNGGSWEYCVATYNYPGREELERLVTWCRQNGIRTAFWNKEDPIHFDRFVEAAKLFDVVFTSDADCIPRYRRALGHDRVHALPFACQPRLHNPIRVPAYREKSVCFAGSYYRNRHPERRQELEWLLDAAMSFELEIYDRAYGQKGQAAEHFRFPGRFSSAIVGGASYRDISSIYKQYKLFLNVNSVTDSPTMLSRRVFELLACGTPVVSTPARGIRELLGEDVVQMVSSEEEARSVLGSLLQDDGLRDRLCLSGQRLVHGAHTYAHRLQEVAARLGYQVAPPAAPKVSIIAWAAARDAMREAIGQVIAQEGAQAELILVVPEGEREEASKLLSEAPTLADSLVLATATPADGESWWEAAIAEASADLIALFSPEDHYGPRYLADLLRAFSYTQADAVGKGTHYATDGPGRPVRLVGEGHEYSYVRSVVPTAMIARRELVSGAGWPDGGARAGEEMEELAAAGARLFAADRYNYLRGGGPDAVGGVDL